MESITVENLCKSYGDSKIFEEVSLSLSEGERLGIKGENGVGKTTFLRCIAGLEDYRGSIEVRKRFSYLFQSSRLMPWLNVRKNILLPLKLKGDKVKRETIRKMEFISEELGVEDILSKKVQEISGGQKQRVLQVRALIDDPDILLLDEPFKSLDGESVKKSYRHFFDVFHSSEKSMIITTHREDISVFSDRVLDFNDLEGVIN